MNPRELDNRSRQLNPNNDSYWQTRGQSKPDNWQDAYNNSPPKHHLDNRANQLNSNNPKYWQSRGYADKPGDWNSSTISASATQVEAVEDNKGSSAWGWAALGIGAAAIGAVLLSNRNSGNRNN